MLQNKKNILIGLGIVLALGLVFVLFGQKMGIRNNNAYSVVYLTTGEVYIGKLTTFPSLELKDSYILQVTKDPADATKNNFQLQPIKEALWAPKKLHINRKNVVFYGLLSSDSAIAKKLAEQK